jgi:hypothetical protein
VLLAVAAAVGACVLLLAVGHVDDRFGVDHVSGSWLGLGAAVRDGVLYPPLHDDGFYGGTRWMPLPFVLYGAADLLTGDLLTGGKLVTYAAALAVLVLVVLACRRRGAGWPVALVLAAAVTASWAGATVFLGVRGDAVSLALGLGAVAVLEGRETTRGAVVSGVLCSLSLLAKLTAVWPVVAIVLWQLGRSRRLAGLVAAVFAGATALLLGLTELVSGGRFGENVVGLAFAGSGDDRGVFQGARTFYDLALRDQRSLWPLLLIGTALAVVALVRRRVGPYELGLLVSLAMLLVVLRDVGARENHLLDATALAAIVAAGAWDMELGRLTTTVRVAVGVAAVLGIALAARHTLLPPARDVVSGDTAQYDPHAFDAVVGEDACVLAEDPTVPLLLDQRPVMLDPFMLPRLGDEESAELAERIRERRFERIVLTVRPDVDPFHFRSLNLGEAVASAIERSYRLVATVPTDPPQYVYAPRAGPRTPCRPRSIRSWSS